MLLPFFLNLKFYIMKLLFGSIIVKGAGRINGHVVRNFRGMPLLTRLALPTRTNIFNANPQLNVSTAAFKYWATLTVEDRGYWSSIAAEIPFTDRWGNTKYLSGRDFVSYLYINLTNIYYSIINPNDFVSTFPSFTSSGIEITQSGAKVIVNDFIPSDTTYQMIFMKLNINSVRNYSAKQLKFIISVDLSTISSDNLYTALSENGCNFQSGQTWTMGIKAISDSGLASEMQLFTCVVD